MCGCVCVCVCVRASNYSKLPPFPAAIEQPRKFPNLRKGRDWKAREKESLERLQCADNVSSDRKCADIYYCLCGLQFAQMPLASVNSISFQSSVIVNVTLICNKPWLQHCLNVKQHEITLTKASAKLAITCLLECRQ
jgi:hypothetical protein